MPEYTVSIDSPEGAANTAEALELFTESLMTDGRPLHPATSLNTQTGVLSTTFQVNADDRDEAAFAACLAYWGALAAAGASVDGDSTVRVVREDETASFTAEAKLSRSSA